jgi:NB-ARC domain
VLHIGFANNRSTLIYTHFIKFWVVIMEQKSQEFGDFLKTILFTYCGQSWNKMRKDLSPTRMGVHVTTIIGWTKGAKPREDGFTQFLQKCDCVPDSVKEELRNRYYDKATWNSETGISNVEDDTTNNIDAVLSYNCIYSKFIGRQSEIRNISSQLRNMDGFLIIAIYGLGGIGKTALAHNLTVNPEISEYFDNIVWYSVADQILDSKNGILTFKVANLTLDTILIEIARQTGQSDILSYTPENRKNAIFEYLRNTKTLVILDNTDTISDEVQYTLLSSLYPFLGSSRIIVTSRHKVKHSGIYEVNLLEMDSADALSFFKKEAEHFDLDIFEAVSDETIMDLVNATGGLPLMMKLIVGQLRDEPFSTVISDLQNARKHIEGTDIEHPHYPLYRYVYRRSWEKLAINSQIVLVCMGRFSANMGAKWDALNNIVLEATEVTEPQLRLSIKQLIDKSLVFKLGSIGKERYALHTNTRRFVLGDIIKVGEAWD